MAITTSPTVPEVSRQELLRRAAGLVPALKARAPETEKQRCVGEDTVRDYREAGLLRIATPARFGGNGHEIDLMFNVAMELGRGCGSSAWCYSVWDIHNWMVGHWPLAAQEDYFATGPDTLSSSSFAPAGKLEPFEGGFMLSGQWEFSSGSDPATWALLGAMSQTGPTFALVPRPDYHVVEDSWHVSGLRGTGSKDVVVDGAFVPAHRLMSMMGMGQASGAWQLHQRDSYRLFGMSLLPFTLCSPIVGMARGAVEEFIAALKDKKGPGRTADSTAIQLRLAESSAEVDAAYRIVKYDSREMIERAGAGDLLSEMDQVTYRRNFGYAAKLCVQSVNRLFDAAGGHGLFADNPMQRYHRDIHAGSHQAALYWDSIGEAYGRAAFGLPAQEMRREVPTIR